jgi:lysine 2,3-aminomutase
VPWSSPTGPACPGWRDVTEAQWRDAQWQRSHCVKNVKQLHELMGDLLDR